MTSAPFKPEFRAALTGNAPAESFTRVWGVDVPLRLVAVQPVAVGRPMPPAMIAAIKRRTRQGAK
jgi:hypothetical protein